MRLRPALALVAAFPLAAAVASACRPASVTPSMRTPEPAPTGPATLVPATAGAPTIAAETTRPAPTTFVPAARPGVDARRRLLPIAEKRGPALARWPGCAPGIAVRQGIHLAVDGRTFAFFGVNAPFLLDASYPPERVEGVIADLAARGVNTIRVWFFHDDDPARLRAALDLGAHYGVRFVVVLGDNVNRGRDWLFAEEDSSTYRPHVERTVRRFADRPEILVWEPLNEPNCADRYDQECLDTIAEWLAMAARLVRSADPCHLVSSGMIGAGNYPADREIYRRVHDMDEIGVLTVHRRTTEERPVESEVAAELDKPIYAGEVYDAAYDEGCQLVDGRSGLGRRAERVKDDLRDSVKHGLDGYLVWDYAPGRVERENETLHLCGPFSFTSGDPLWRLLAESGTIPAVPWRQ